MAVDRPLNPASVRWLVAVGTAVAAVTTSLAALPVGYEVELPPGHDPWETGPWVTVASVPGAVGVPVPVWLGCWLLVGLAVAFAPRLEWRPTLAWAVAVLAAVLGSVCVGVGVFSVSVTSRSGSEWADRGVMLSSLGMAVVPAVAAALLMTARTARAQSRVLGVIGALAVVAVLPAVAFKIALMAQFGGVLAGGALAGAVLWLVGWRWWRHRTPEGVRRRPHPLAAITALAGSMIAVAMAALLVVLVVMAHIAVNGWHLIDALLLFVVSLLPAACARDCEATAREGSEGAAALR
jgi:hypothetical protein